MNDYVEDRLAGRRIWWCPGGEGYLAYCPQPTDSDAYNYCCIYYYLGADRPSCCMFPLHTGVMIAILFSSIVIVIVLLFLTCWFCPSCLLAKKLLEREERQCDEVSDQQQDEEDFVISKH